VGAGFEAFDWGSADPLRRRIYPPQIRISLLQPLQLAQKRIVLGVSDLRPILQVIEPIVSVQLVDELACSTIDGGLVRRLQDARLRREIPIKDDPATGR
jgi:hypothetical protein